jgi:ribonuclease R
MAEALGHFALACDEYTHFTSPIRRYPDLIVHRLLKWALENPHAKGVEGFYRIAELEEIAVESSEAERRADLAERELMDWKTAQFMEQHLGDEYTGLIISVHKFGFFVELLELFVEGLVPIAAIEEFTGGGCFYRESDRAILIERGGRRTTSGRAPGASVKAFRLGDRVRIRAERIDPFQKRVEFALI